jgi:hypothetical protein
MAFKLAIDDKVGLTIKGVTVARTGARRKRSSS